MLFCNHELFEVVNTAGLSLKMIRYRFGLKQSPGFGFNHTIFRLLAHSLRVYYAYFLRRTFTLDWLEQYAYICVDTPNTRNDLLYYFTAHWSKSLRVMYAHYAYLTRNGN